MSVQECLVPASLAAPLVPTAMNPIPGPAVHTLAASLDVYLPIFIMVVLAILFAIINITATLIMGPRLRGRTKGSTYESGMTPVGTARKRFNVRFYILAMTFLLFDVEIIFLFPWAVTYSQVQAQGPEAALFLGRILFFIAASVVAYIYAWKKGVFAWD